MMDERKERVKEWWNRNPCCITTSKKAGKEFFQEIENVVYTMHPWIRGYFVGCQGKRVLEVGCGMGRDLVNFAKGGAIVTGLDMSNKSIELARTNFKLNGQKGSFLIGDAENIAFPDNSFDMVYSYGVLHHTVDTRRGIDECHRVLKTGGQALIMLYNKWSLARLSHPSIRKYETKVSNEEEDCPILETFSAGDAKRMFSKFTSVKTEKRHIGRFQGRLPEFVERMVGWHLIIKATK